MCAHCFALTSRRAACPKAQVRISAQKSTQQKSDAAYKAKLENKKKMQLYQDAIDNIHELHKKREKPAPGATVSHTWFDRGLLGLRLEDDPRGVAVQ